jgi:hypothetical protein
MTASLRTPFYLLLCLGFGVTSWARAGPADDLLPPPVRQTEKRALGADNEQVRRAYYDGRGGIGAAFSPDGKFLVASGGYQGILLWEVGTGRALGQLTTRSNHEGLAAAFTPDGKQLVAANWTMHQESCPITVWDVARRERLRTLDEDVNDTPFTALAVAPDGKTVALGAGWSRRNLANTIFFWDLASGDEIGRADGPANPGPARRNDGAWGCQALAYSPDGRTLAALAEGRILFVEVATGKPRGQATFEPAQESRVGRMGVTLGALAFAADGRILVAGCSDGAVRRFDLRTGRELTPLPGHSGPVVALCCTPDGKSIYSYGIDGQFYAWRVDSPREWKPKAAPLPEGAIEILWDALRSEDPLDRFGCQEALAAAPAQAVPFLRKHLSPTPQADMERIERLVADVQNSDYNARKKSVRELRKIGAPVFPALVRAQERGAHDELSRRLFFEFQTLAPPPEQLRAVRAVRVLERIGNGDARKLLQELSRGADAAALTVQAKAALDRLARTEPAKASQASEALWDALVADDSAAAYRAVRALANRPTAAALLRDRLMAVAAKDTFNDDPKRVAKLIADLDSDDFAVRDQASKALRNLGRLVVPSLQQRLGKKPSLDTKRRLEVLLDEATRGMLSPEVLRVGRALETLELMGGAGARQALEAVAKDVGVKWIRDAAEESLRRQR